MRKTTPVIVFAMLAALCAGLLLTGCGGDDNGAQPTSAGGTITGITRDAVSGALLGGVQVAVQGPSGQWYTATSRYPSGQFVITGLPSGTYTRLRVRPDPTIGPEQNFTVNIAVSDAGPVDVGTVLIFDELPPRPIS